MPSNNVTNMDTENNKQATVPVLRFGLRKDEVAAPLSVGMHGTLSVPFKVVDATSDMVFLEKVGDVQVLDSQEGEPAERMKERIGRVDEDEER